MPITKSAKKANNRSFVFQKRNNEFKLRMKMAIKKFLKNPNKSQDELNIIYKYIDKCNKVGIIKKNTASRKKSRVAKALAKQSK
jgi:small subunit ribosomal protein S20